MKIAVAAEMDPAEPRVAATAETVKKMKALGEILASVGLKAPTPGVLRASLFKGILQAVEGSENQLFINEVVLRSQSQAAYAAENYGHFGLNLRRYAHFTSPIRRYADLFVHRSLVSALGLGNDGLSDWDVVHAGQARAAREADMFDELASGRTTIELLGLHDGP